MNILMQLLGRLHPIIVHLPIGFIVLGVLFLFYDRKKKAMTKVVSLSFLWGGISAIFACVNALKRVDLPTFGKPTIPH